MNFTRLTDEQLTQNLIPKRFVPPTPLEKIKAHCRAFFTFSERISINTATY